MTPRNAPTIVGAAHNIWLFWDGRKDSQWSQALGSIENPLEHNMPRDRIVAVIHANPDLSRDYVAIFGALPTPDDRDGINRAFAEYRQGDRRLRAENHAGTGEVRPLCRCGPGRTANLRRRTNLTLDERQGLHVFISDQLGRCLRCHNGPLFTNEHFHNIGVAEPIRRSTLADGRIVGVELARADEFNCMGKYSDAAPGDCAELTFARRNSPELRRRLQGADFAKPAEDRALYARGDRRLLEDVLWHYRTLPNARVGKSELNDLHHQRNRVRASLRRSCERSTARSMHRRSTCVRLSPSN